MEPAAPTLPRRSRASVGLGLLGACMALSAFAVYTNTRTSPDLPPRAQYFAQIALFALTAATALIVAFFAARERRVVLARGLLVVCALIGMLAAGDMYVLTMRYDSSGPGGVLCLTHLNWHRRYVHNNEDGFWDDDFAPYVKRAQPDGQVIAAVGDSFTWGQGLPGRALRFTDQLEHMLRERGRPAVHVLNFGKGGTGTRLQNEQIIPAVHSVRPDVVLLFYLFNDLEDTLRLIRVNENPFSGFERRWLAATPSLNFLFWRVVAPGRFSSTTAQMALTWVTNYLDDESFAGHVRELQRMMSAVREMGARPGVVILPFPHVWIYVNEPFRDRIYDRLSNAFAEMDVPVLSLRSTEDRFPPGAFELNAIDSHPSPAVHRAIAEETVDWLLDTRLAQ